MKALKRYTLLTLAAMAIATSALAQDDGSTGSVVRRRSGDRNAADQQGQQVTQRMQSFYEKDGSNLSEADLQWMRVIYRQIDLDKDQNAALYFPEEPVEGQENLFRIIMRLLADNRLAAYEYLDGREVFTDQYKVKLRDVLDRFYIPYTEAKGSTEKNPKFTIMEADVPSNEVLSYYIIERWEFDTRSNRMRTRVEAICPVLHRSGDFGGEAVKYPMFWVKFDDIRPWLAQQAIFINDDNNMPTCSYDDFFNLTMYDGEIYKTRNLKNKSMMQLYPDPEDRKRAQDSIQARLDRFEEKLWVANREDVINQKPSTKEPAVEAGGDSLAIVQPDVVADDNSNKKSSRSTKRSAKKEKKPSQPKKSKVKESKPKTNNSSSADKSVRRRKK